MILRRVLYLLPVIFLCGLLLLGGRQVAVAQGPDSETFENGHTVNGAFYELYKSVDDPDRVFGMPITVTFDDPLPPGKQIQYFERVRMELDPGTNQVSLASLGEFAYDSAQPGLQAPIQPNDPQCRTFSNGKLACYGFLRFYDQYGEKYFGLPVTNAMFTAEGRLVQYFQNVRMEWRGEMPEGKRVVLTALGQFDFDKRIGNPSYRRPVPGDIPGNMPVPIIPSLRTFAGHPLVANGDRQQVFVMLHDQFGEPIKGVPVTVTFFSPENNPEGSGISGLTTNDDGIATAEYTVSDTEPNDVVLAVVTARIGETELTAKTWFRIWW